MKFFLVFLISLAFSMPCFASGGSGNVEIKEIHQRECNNDKDFEVILWSPHDNPDSCSTPNIINFSCSHKAFAQITSLATSAMIAEKRVWIWLNGCDAQGHAKGSTIKVIK